MSYVGYQWLIDDLQLDAAPPRRPAKVGPVSRILRQGDSVTVPARLSPSEKASVLEHLLFALKNEDFNLGIVMPATRAISREEVSRAFQAKPGGQYIRLACYFWEIANEQLLADLPDAGGNYVRVFDPERFVTGQSVRNTRWRVNFNGLGTPAYCATVELTQAIRAELEQSVLEQVNEALTGMDAVLRDRALEWAYLSETQGSFAIENETPVANKRDAFVKVLQQAHGRKPLCEDYLAQLQNVVITNTLDQAVGFRHQQNYLARAGRGAMAVSYIPPPPGLASELMRRLMDWANAGLDGAPPMVAAAVVSFGFVYIHPFMDGNGRLSRYLMHHILCTTGALGHGMILPMSVAMSKHEAEYLAALESYSQPMRRRWDVTWLGDEHYQFEYKGDSSFSPYRYWDATAAVEFSLKMAKIALDQYLRDEAAFLMRFDAALKIINEAIDIQSNYLVVLLRAALENKGVVSKRRRDQYALSVPAGHFDVIEETAKSVLADLDEEPDAAHRRPAASG